MHALFNIADPMASDEETREGIREAREAVYAASEALDKVYDRVVALCVDDTETEAFLATVTDPAVIGVAAEIACVMKYQADRFWRLFKIAAERNVRLFPGFGTVYEAAVMAGEHRAAEKVCKCPAHNGEPHKGDRLAFRVTSGPFDLLSMMRALRM